MADGIVQTTGTSVLVVGGRNRQS